MRTEKPAKASSTQKEVKALPKETEVDSYEQMESHTDLTPAQEKAFADMQGHMGTVKPAKKEVKALPKETEVHSDEQMESHTDLTPTQQKAFTEMETNMGTEKPAKASSTQKEVKALPKEETEVDSYEQMESHTDLTPAQEKAFADMKGHMGTVKPAKASSTQEVTEPHSDKQMKSHTDLTPAQQKAFEEMETNTGTEKQASSTQKEVKALPKEIEVHSDEQMESQGGLTPAQQKAFEEMETNTVTVKPAKASSTQKEVKALPKEIEVHSDEQMASQGRLTPAQQKAFKEMETNTGTVKPAKASSTQKEVKALPKEIEVHSDEQMESQGGLTPAQQKAFTEMETNTGTLKPAKATLQQTAPQDADAVVPEEEELISRDTEEGY